MVRAGGIRPWLCGNGLDGEPPKNPRTPAERRIAPRYSGSQVTSCQIIALPSKVPVQVKLRDISSGGLGLLARESLAKGTFLAVDLLGTKDFHLRLRAQVVHATPQSNGLWVLGCVLERELGREELEAML